VASSVRLPQTLKTYTRHYHLTPICPSPSAVFPFQQFQSVLCHPPT
jgi:hypothetical protein